MKEPEQGLAAASGLTQHTQAGTQLRIFYKRGRTEESRVNNMMLKGLMSWREAGRGTRKSLMPSGKSDPDVWNSLPEILC